VIFKTIYLKLVLIRSTHYDQLVVIEIEYMAIQKTIEPCCPT